MKTACWSCGGHIAYDPVISGLEVTCPHCSIKVTLPGDQAASPVVIHQQKPRSALAAGFSGVIGVVFGLIFLAALGIGFLIFIHVSLQP